MNGAQILSSSYIITGSNNAQPRPDSSWSIAGLGDFDGDGKTDILWRQASTGAVVEWNMVGPIVSAAGNSTNLTFQGNVVAPDASWSVVEVADFNGDGRADILWRQSTTGSLGEWIMGGSQILASQTVTSQSSAVAPDGSCHPQAFPTNAGYRGNERSENQRSKPRLAGAAKNYRNDATSASTSFWSGPLERALGRGPLA